MKLTISNLAASVAFPLALSLMTTVASAQTVVPPGAPVTSTNPLNALTAPDMGNLETALAQAQTSRKNGDLAGATKVLSQLVLFAPDDPRVLGEYGKTLVAQGRSDDALAFLERAIQLAPADWTLYSAQGVAYDQKGIYKQGQASYARALSLKPGEPAILNNAALSHMQAGDLEGAEKLLLEVPPGDADARIKQNLAMVRSLKSSRSSRPQPAPPPAAAPATQVASATPPSAPAPAPEANLPEKNAPVTTASLPAPTAEETKTAEAPQAMPEALSTAEGPAEEPTKSVALSGVAALQADPSVRMQKPPKEETPPAPKAAKAPAPKAAPKVVSAPKAPKPAPVEKKPAPATKVAQNTAKPAASGGGTYYVQAGAYASEERAGKMAASLDSMGARVSTATIDGRSIYRVRIGPFADVRQANAAMEAAQSLGQKDLRLVSE